eukprot:CAMPEP_0181406550 /NCGR_PEP_ID=MMETSP1110-20121109/5329_1 /TAXON_ID=174948 /ORGANISM="Symbiodinium sp., Strain CCMP421" /LENGTH=210 /DNA_ID=CAMNT_0023528965 /DNA_START=21 /DNA_END=653 /DNA_ORIENTATION=-
MISEASSLQATTATDDERWRGASAVFLRNIPSKCDRQTLSRFFRSLGLHGYDVDVALHPNGKCRGYARVRFRSYDALDQFVAKVHLQFLPGFHKPTPLYCEPMRTPPEEDVDDRNLLDDVIVDESVIPSEGSVPISPAAARWIRERGPAAGVTGFELAPELVSQGAHQESLSSAAGPFNCGREGHLAPAVPCTIQQSRKSHNKMREEAPT